MDGISFEESEAFDIICMRIQIELNIFFMYQKKNSNALVFEAVQETGHIGLSNKMNFLEHYRNFDCISLFWRFCNGKCFAKIREIVPNTHISLLSIGHLARRSAAYCTYVKQTTIRSLSRNFQNNKT